MKIWCKTTEKQIRQMREELFSKLMDLPVKYLDTHSHGDVMSRMTNDVENISTTVSQSLPSLFSGVLTIIGTVAVMLWYCWQLALLSLATVLLTVMATKILSGRVRKFSHVDFAYTPGNPVLRDFTLQVPSGKKVALVGATGSGKSSFENLVPRFYDVKSGALLVDGVDVREYDQQALRSKIAVITSP